MPKRCRCRRQRARAWDLIGTQITSLTDDPENYITFMRVLGDNPAALSTGIPVAMLPGMADLADDLGMVRLGPGSLGNREIASTMPIIRYGAAHFQDVARRMENDMAGPAGAPATPTPSVPQASRKTTGTAASWKPPRITSAPT